MSLSGGCGWCNSGMVRCDGLGALTKASAAVVTVNKGVIKARDPRFVDKRLNFIFGYFFMLVCTDVVCVQTKIKLWL